MPKALEDLEKRVSADDHGLILDALEDLQAGLAAADVKNLAGWKPPTWRLRIGKWRALLAKVGDLWIVVRVLDRREAYSKKTMTWRRASGAP